MIGMITGASDDLCRGIYARLESSESEGYE
jgi:hypothetical protein